MKISWNCLNQIIDLSSVNYLDLTNQLTLAGLETENIVVDTNIGDIVFEINLMSNRQDVRNIVDIAVEISALLKQKLKLDGPFWQSNINSKLSYFYCIEGTTNKYVSEIYYGIVKLTGLKFYDTSLINCLKVYGIEATNSILDLVTFVNIKWGQSIKMYQVETTNLNTLQDIQLDIFYHNIDNFMLVDKVYCNQNVVKEVTQDNFRNYNEILLLTYQYKKTKNNSILFDKYSIYAYQDMINLLAQYNVLKSKSQRMYVRYRLDKPRSIISCSIDKINNVLGPTSLSRNYKFLNSQIIINILKLLDFTVVYRDNQFYLGVPNRRANDIVEQVDIIEEIGRIYGFDNFKDQIPIFDRSRKKQPLNFILQKLRRNLRDWGLHEVVSYSLYNLNSDYTIKIVNPLSTDQQTLRTNLIHNLVLNKIYNLNQGNQELEVFEIGKVFIQDYFYDRVYECLHLAGILGRNNFNRSTWQSNVSDLTWFQAKGHLENLFEKIGASVTWSQYSYSTYLVENIEHYIHPKRTVYILGKQGIVGFLSQINTRKANRLGISCKTYFFEINVVELQKTIQNVINLQYIYISYSNYPKIMRDISIQINRELNMEYVKQVILAMEINYIDYLESISILNEYSLQKQSLRSVILRVIYRAQNKTLTNKAIEILTKHLKQSLYLALANII